MKDKISLKVSKLPVDVRANMYYNDRSVIVVRYELAKTWFEDSKGKTDFRAMAEAKA